MPNELTREALDEIERLARCANEACEGIMRRYAALTTLLTPTVVLALVALAREGRAARETAMRDPEFAQQLRAARELLCDYPTPERPGR